MKKKLIISLLILSFCIGFAVPCQAESVTHDVTLDLSDLIRYETARSLCWVQDTLYILGSKGIYQWQPGDASASVYMDLSAMEPYSFMQSEPTEPDAKEHWEQAISLIFSNGDSLYGLHPYSGSIYTITQDGLEKHSSLPSELLYIEKDDMSFFRSIMGTSICGETLFLLLGTDDFTQYDKTELISYNLHTGDMKRNLFENAKAIVGTDNSKLYLLHSSEKSAIWQYNCDNGITEELPTALPNEANGLAWYAPKESVISLISGKVMLFDHMGPVVKAYLPVPYNTANVTAACSTSGLYAYPYGQYVFIKDISFDGEAKQSVLNVVGNIPTDLAINFSMQNPDISVVILNSNLQDQLQQTLLTSANNVDILITSAPGDFAAVKQKGFAASLNSETQLVDMAKQLYPSIQNVIFDGENLMAYPITMQPSTWTLNETRWEELELGKYPTTYSQLFNTISIWLDNYAELYPEETLSDIQQFSLDMLVSMIVKEYILQNENSNEQLTFDTPSFRSLLKDICENSHLISEENNQWGMPLVFSYNQGFGYTYNDDDRMCMLLPPSLNEDKPQIMGAELEVMFVNAASQNQEAAKRFVSFCVHNLNITTQYMMNPTMNDPYPNPSYESRMKTLCEELEALKAELVTTTDEQALVLRDKIVQKEMLIETVENNKWEIAPESIMMYRDAAEHLYIPYTSAYFDRSGNGGYGSIEEVISQFCMDGLDEAEIDAFIRDLNRVSYMIYMEME